MRNTKPIPVPEHENDAVDRLFQQALAQPPHLRQEYLARHASGDEALFREVNALLEAHQNASTFLRGAFHSGIESAMVFAPGETVAGFVILKLIDSGSFAHVYLAHQVALGREVALKISADQGTEAKLLAPLEHENIVRVHSQSTEPGLGLRILCMQYVPGVNLEKALAEVTGRKLPLQTGQDLLKIVRELSADDTITEAEADQYPLSRLDYLDTVMRLGAQLARGLAHAHGRQVLHLDVKPANVLITPSGKPMLIDFNVSLGGVRDRKNESLIGGTFAYMSPEQRDFFSTDGSDSSLEKKIHSIDGRADLYSLGKLLEKLLSAAGTSDAVGEQPPLASLRPAARVTRVLRGCTAERPEDRLPSAQRAADLMEALLESRHLERALPRAGRLIKLMLKHPRTSLIVSGVVPQVGIVLWSFGFWCIYRGPWGDNPILSMVDRFMLVQHPAMMLASLGLWILWVWDRERRTERDLTQSVDTETIDRARRRFLKLPRHAAVLSLLGWLPTLPLWKTVLTSEYLGVQSYLLTVLVGSTVLPWIFGVCYTYILTYLVVLRVYYLPLWAGTNSLPQTATKELSHLKYHLFDFHLAPLGLFLIGAYLSGWMLVSNFREGSFYFFFNLLSNTIFSVLWSAMFLTPAIHYLAQILYALIDQPNREDSHGPAAA